MAYKLMIQGTMSGAGKSLLTAGLLRIFHKDGYRCAPFKSQNMALNSYITKDGLEIGRAQAMQAEAAGTIPSVYMNPILLKPNSDMGSQIIVNGEVRGNMQAVNYFKYKKELVPEIMNAFHALEEEYDIIVIEGAGSPAEINLKADDIVNMGLAKMVDAPVLLAGDIDRGGVFAQLYGTVALLSEEERNRIKGLIINKFRGDDSLLTSGLRQIEQLCMADPVRCNAKVIGVVPYMKVDIEEEDSLSERLEKRESPEEDAQKPYVCVLRLPHLSNYTDFDPLQREERLRFSYADRPEELQNADLIILPGSKNTMADLEWLKEKGLATKIRQKAAEGTRIMGICGGYQMLGRSVADPDGAEHGGTMEALGLLPADTILQNQKVRTRVSGCVDSLNGAFSCLSGLSIQGYEIHMGETQGRTDSFANIKDQNGCSKVDGAACRNIVGTYVHGLFESDTLRTALLKELLREKGNTDLHIGIASQDAYKEEQFDILEETIRKHVDIPKIYEIIGINNL